jgi:hypothetical protein
MSSTTNDWASVKSGISTIGKKTHRKIEFRPASKASNAFSNGLVASKLGSVAQRSSQAIAANKQQPSYVKKVSDDGVSGPVPGLFDPQIAVENMKWKSISRAGPGGSVYEYIATSSVHSDDQPLASYHAQDSSITATHAFSTPRCNVCCTHLRWPRSC